MKSIIRKYNIEEMINACLPYQEQFNFGYFCNDFKPRNQNILRLTIRNSNALKAKEVFRKALRKWNKDVRLNKFLSVVGVACDGNKGSNIAILYLNFNTLGENQSDNIQNVYDFLSVLPFKYGCQTLFSNNAVSGLYQQINWDSIFFTNIANLHLYQGNKIIQTVCFEKINPESLQSIINEKIQLHNREYPDNILNMIGSIKLSFDGFPVLTCHSYLQKGSKIDLQFRLAELWKNIRHIILIDSYETYDDTISLMNGEILTGGIMVGNIEEPIGTP